MRIGIRTIKTAVGVTIAVAVAQWLQLMYYASAGVLTMLSIQQTRRQSIRTVADRFFSCLVGLAVAGLCFAMSGFHIWVFPVIFLITIPLCVFFKIQGGITSSSVVIMHAYIHKEISATFVLNELGIISVGLGVGLLMNMYMPGIDRRIRAYQSEIDRLVGAILAHIAKHLRAGDMTWDGQELLRLEDALDEARELARQDVENHVTRKAHHYYDDFENKNEQFRILQRMLPLVSRMDRTLEQGERIGRLIEELSRDIAQMQDTSRYMQRLQEIRQHHKQLPLPTTRVEFESRACLYHLANELELLINKVNERPHISNQRMRQGESR